jgi:hypothetical protein
MKSSTARLLLGCLVAPAFLAADSFAQRPSGKIKGPTGKIFTAEARGDSVLRNGGKIYPLRQNTAFDATGSEIETKSNSHTAVVYSNGTGMSVSEDTRLEIRRFTQEPFQPDRNDRLDSALEPSISQSDVLLAHGAVGLSTSQMITGSTMLYTTPHARINIRGGKISIVSSPSETIVDLLEGDLTISPDGNDTAGQLLHAGERAIIRSDQLGGRELLLTIQPIQGNLLKETRDRIAVADNARKTVTFELVEKLAAAGLESVQEIVPKPTVPQNPPRNIVVSPDRLPGT